MSRQKSDVEGRLRLAETQITELANSVRQKDTELQVGNMLHQSFLPFTLVFCCLTCRLLRITIKDYSDLHNV